jgi:hypothetical protein
VPMTSSRCIARILSLRAASRGADHSLAKRRGGDG